MPNGHILELSTLPTCQPFVGDALLRAHAWAAIIRLRLDPTPLPPGTMSKEVNVIWSPKAKKKRVQRLKRSIGWGNILDLDSKCCQYRRTFNDHNLTEQAAIAVMALLIHDREGGVVQQVLQIGSGGDYLVLTRRARKPDQIEVSGIHTDADGSRSQQRLVDKTDQVLTHSKVGFASVTTFAHSQAATAHSYLYFVRRKRKRRK